MVLVNYKEAKNKLSMLTLGMSFGGILWYPEEKKMT